MTKDLTHLICFDMDGVLISSMLIANQLFYEMVEKELGLPLYDYPQQKSLMALSAEERIERLWEDDIREKGITQSEIDRAMDHFRQMKIDAGVPILPDAKKALELMAENFEHLACVSSNREAVIDEQLTGLGVRHFFTKITGIDHVRFSKPDPEIYAQTAEYFGIEPAKCLTFEDSTHGIHSAKSAGMKAIAVATGLESVEELQKTDADLILPDLSGLDLDTVKILLSH